MNILGIAAFFLIFVVGFALVATIAEILGDKGSKDDEN